jgi:hypothetical protein
MIVMATDMNSRIKILAYAAGIIVALLAGMGLSNIFKPTPRPPRAE